MSALLICANAHAHPASLLGSDAAHQLTVASVCVFLWQGGFEPGPGDRRGQVLQDLHQNALGGVAELDRQGGNPNLWGGALRQSAATPLHVGRCFNRTAEAKSAD